MDMILESKVKCSDIIDICFTALNTNSTVIF